MEIWKDVEGYEGIYQVSYSGKIKSLERIVFKKDGKQMPIKGRIMGFNLNKGYFVVKLCKNGECKKVLVHRLIAKAFIPNPENKPFINHKN